MKVSIIQETKNRWERRAPLVPADVERLVREHGIDISVGVSPIRIFADAMYGAAGAHLVYSVANADVVLGIKEPPIDAIGEGQLFVVFSHTHKGQSYNMPLLKRFLDQRATLVDYERIVDEQGRRLIAFGHYAGVAGAIDTVWGLARRLDALGIRHPLEEARLTWEYGTTSRAWGALEQLGRRVKDEGFEPDMAPVVFGIVGCGNVGRGAGEVLDHLCAVQISPSDLGSMEPNPHALYRVDLVESDLYERIDGSPFELQDYYDHPDRYRCIADGYLDHITALINTAYWDASYPRVVPRESLRRFADSHSRMLVIGDVACDVGGSIEATLRCTDLDAPSFVYDPFTGEGVPGFEGRGTAVLSVDHLPCELSQEASAFFSNLLVRFLPQLREADLDVPFAAAGLPPELARAVIVWNGALTPDYKYLEAHLRESGLID